MISAAFAFLGRHAPLAIAMGCLGALLLPELSAALRPALPALVALVLGVAAARLDLGEMLRASLSLREMTRLLAITGLLMPLMALSFSILAKLLPLPAGAGTGLVLMAAAPPIASATSLCLILGFSARLALQITLIGALLTPLIGPALIAALLPEVPAISPALLSLRLALMLGAGLIIGLALRWLVTPEGLARRAQQMDGLSAAVMVLFVIPLFDGVGPAIREAPAAAAAMLLVVCCANFGANVLIGGIARIWCAPQSAGALGLIAGNRNTALYLAALPPDPALALFVALYQIPMYATPLLWRARGAA